ncbi:MAG: hypothetical protein ACKV22_40065 [Bryobacteraceae bacterium]
MTAAFPATAGQDPCRAPLDARYFDESEGPVTVKPVSADPLQLARFELPFGYCGTLEAFWQFTDTYAGDNAEISTPGFEWLLLINGQPVAPYLGLRTIFQPWGWPAQKISIRLPVNALVEFTLRVVTPRVGTPPAAEVKVVAGRIFGRYWYSEE